MKKKKILILIPVYLLLFAASFGIAYAYLIGKETKVNEFTVGENTVEVTEDFEPPEELKPGAVIKKDVRITNTGNLPCFVRLRADFSDSKAKEFCEYTINASWTDGQDGWYYYNKLVYPGETTEPFFDGEIAVKTQKEDGNAYTLADMIEFDILIYVESCQHSDHTGACAEDEYQTVWK